jgi:hypothetical protein
VPVILCDEWTPTQVKAFRQLVNRSATWADWDDELLALELGDLQGLDFNLDLTGFDVHEIEERLGRPEPEDANTAPPLPEIATSRPDDFRVLSGEPNDLHFGTLSAFWLTVPGSAQQEAA